MNMSSVQFRLNLTISSGVSATMKAAAFAASAAAAALLSRAPRSESARCPARLVSWYGVAIDGFSLATERLHVAPRLLFPLVLAGQLRQPK